MAEYQSEQEHPAGGDEAPARERLEIEQWLADNLFRLSPMPLGTGLVAAGVLALFLEPVLSTAWLTAWCLIIAAANIGRMVLGQRVLKRRPLPAWLPSPLNLYILAAVISGCTWGSLGVLLAPDWPLLDRLIVIVALAGVAAGALTSHAVFFRLYAGFQLPVLVPLCLHSLADAGLGGWRMALLVVLYGASLLLTAHRQSVQQREAASLAARNRRLTRRLSASNRALTRKIRQWRTTHRQLLEAGTELAREKGFLSRIGARRNG